MLTPGVTNLADAKVTPFPSLYGIKLHKMTRGMAVRSNRPAVA